MERTDELSRLRGFSVALQSTLERFVVINGERIDIFDGIERLDRLVREAALGAVDSAAVDEWMRSYSTLAESDNLAPEVRRRVSRMLLELQTHVDQPLTRDRSPESRQEEITRIRERFANWRARSVEVGPASAASAERIAETLAARRDSSPPVEPSAPRRIILRRQPEENAELINRFFERMWSQMEYLEHEIDSGRHALTVLDDLLAMAEAKTDRQYEHLAASLIFFLKQEGYKMAPYIQRLRELPERRKGPAPR
ncbi:MAG TPA: hypothetical protein VLB27_11535 [candidate division Zixibacteria bacterium]|nr:hypothetical protein [candidate division Zixibacteria bacterium]